MPDTRQDNDKVVIALGVGVRVKGVDNATQSRLDLGRERIRSSAGCKKSWDGARN
ncbi:hypothetical protein ACRALDRAFT_2020619 [Sodiomyces alcalophilus JCM 7366]|uniref:uncharacterized protein n=1 Tax=Sodiomyces alcalophilus JCM 7366 TaxID=591952 RepID=UPI0039B6D648